ncbi:unnamed protein product [Lathyrus oleraceus]|uniref:SHSP domain-containing protein n=1 Tax=Pisum sativum TaxID=3888 RepID=A0A9D4X2L7_PEA|nr:inactive protein RESTRICTED TEV MOVEMENT 2-like [Pisum sativum]KAI5411145.1 hypothetical protein KIW84_056327 [Pisum sativum]
MVSTLQSYVYEDLDPKIETQNTQESHLFIVHIPDGFTKGDFGAKIEYDFGRVRIFGERSIGPNKKMRFNEKYQVPSHCDIGNIRGKFDGKTVTITMPNIPGKVPQQEQKPIEENTCHQDPKKTYSMIIDKLGDGNEDDEKKSDKKSFGESTKTRIKDMALSTTQAVTNYAKRFHEEDRQKLIYTGATILVVALGVYASYKYRSSRRS